MAPKSRAHPGRRASDKWTIRFRILKDTLVIVGGIVTAICSAYIGQKSNDPALENRQAMQRLEEVARLRAENERLKQAKK